LELRDGRALELLISTGKVDLVTRKRDVLVAVIVAVVTVIATADVDVVVDVVTAVVIANVTGGVKTELAILGVVVVIDAAACEITETGGCCVADDGDGAIPDEL
uniref:Secreted protein n=1 Tax=Brugia timori TaxID=42155 RepID=A0A0R3RBC0_9BILA